MFRPKYQCCWWSAACCFGKSCSVFSVHCSPPTVGGGRHGGMLPKLGVLGMPHLLALGGSMPESPSTSLGMEETKGWAWRVGRWARYEDTFGFSEDNEHSFASSCHRRRKARHPQHCHQHQHRLHHDLFKWGVISNKLPSPKSSSPFPSPHDEYLRDLSKKNSYKYVCFFTVQLLALWI